MTPNQFRTARLAKGMTQAKAAAYLGTARNTVSRYERGERPIPPLVAIRMAGPPDELVEAVARQMVCESTGTRDPDKMVPAPRGVLGFIPLWRSYEHLARAAITASLDWMARNVD